MIPTPTLCSLLKNSEIRVKERLSLHTSFGIGGPCNMFIIPKTISEIKYILQYATQNKIPLITIGNGTNILFPDKGIEGIVMKISNKFFGKMVLQNSLLRVGAGTLIHKLLQFTTHQGIGGLEFMAGIPGTVGGAVVMNAGAKERSIGDYIERVRVVTRENCVQWIRKEDIKFRYRYSRFKDNSQEVIIEVELKLFPDDPNKIRTKIQSYLSERRKKFPLEFPSAGCVFKNPPNISAGKLIELAGCKEMQVGKALLSSRHANFIVNTGNATYEDVKTLISKVQTKVYKKFKILLEPELIVL
jgi:UDP-N-acetylmuramate dehydrogenase